MPNCRVPSIPLWFDRPHYKNRDSASRVVVTKDNALSTRPRSPALQGTGSLKLPTANAAVREDASDTDKVSSSVVESQRCKISRGLAKHAILVHPVTAIPLTETTTFRGHFWSLLPLLSSLGRRSLARSRSCDDNSRLVITVFAHCALHGTIGHWSAAKRRSIGCVNTALAVGWEFTQPRILHAAKLCM